MLPKLVRIASRPLRSVRDIRNQPDPILLGGGHEAVPKGPIVLTLLFFDAVSTERATQVLRAESPCHLEVATHAIGRAGAIEVIVPDRCGHEIEALCIGVRLTRVGKPV